MRLIIEIPDDRVSGIFNRCMGRPLMFLSPDIKLIVTNEAEIIADDVQRYLRDKDIAVEKAQQENVIRVQTEKAVKAAAPVESKITVTVEK
jgi:hypothetical protein